MKVENSKDCYFRVSRKEENGCLRKELAGIGAAGNSKCWATLGNAIEYIRAAVVDDPPARQNENPLERRER